MPLSSVAEAIDAAIAMEESVRGIYLSFERMFAPAPGAAEFFRSLAADEAEHARLWREIRGALSPARLADPPSGLLQSSLEAVQALLAKDLPARVTTLKDAYELTSLMENAELLAVFRVMAIELIPERSRREFLSAQIQGHLARVERQTAGPGRCGRVDSLPRDGGR